MAVPPVPYQTPLSDQGGILTRPWADWFRQLLSSVGSGGGGSVTYPITIDKGGTGQTTQQAALNALSGSQSAGKYLRSDGTNVSLTSLQVGDVPTLNQDTTGVASNVTGTVAIGHGGTGATTQQAALDNLTGTQSAGKYLRSDGTHATLTSIQAADIPTLNQNTTGTAAGLSSTLAIGSGGTGQTTQQAAINALTGTQSAGKYLRSDGTNATLSTIQAADVPTLNQNTTGTASSVTGTNVVTNSNLSQMATNTIKGNNTGLTANALDLTATQVTAMLNLFSSTLQGLVPASGGGTSKFLRADGSWAATSTVAATAPTVQRFTSTGTQTGTLFNISAPASNISSGAVYTNNGHSFTVLAAVTTSQSGWVLFCSGTGATSGTSLALSSGTGPASVTFSATQNLATYTTPTSPAPLYLKVKMVGGGGGASGAGSTGGGTGGTGGPSAFGALVLTATGGAGAAFNSNGGAGGTVSVNSPAISVAALSGAQGQGATNISTGATNGGNGASSPFGGAGAGAFNTSAGGSAVANSGSGGGGGGAVSDAGGAGGGAGGYIDAIIGSPANTYYYTVGPGGAGGSAGTSGNAGGAGGSGIVIVEECYQ